MPSRASRPWARRKEGRHARLSAQAAEPFRAAAKHYGEAFRLYDRFRAEVENGVPPGSRGDRARTPERIAVIAPLLERGISAEVRALDALGRAAQALE